MMPPQIKATPKLLKATKRRQKRKIRTPEHVRADMSLHHVTYGVVKCGFSIEASRADYGYDASVAFYSHNGEVEISSFNWRLRTILIGSKHLVEYHTQLIWEILICGLIIPTQFISLFLTQVRRLHIGFTSKNTFRREVSLRIASPRRRLQCI